MKLRCECIDTVFAFGKDFADRGGFGGEKGGMGGKGSDDVKLKYIDDSFESYSNIFDNAKTDITDADKTRLIGIAESSF